MRNLRRLVNPHWGTGNRAARLRLAFFFRAEPSQAALLRIIINKLRSLRSLGGMRGGSECEARAGLNIETAETAHLLRFKCYRM